MCLREIWQEGGNTRGIGVEPGPKRGPGFPLLCASKPHVHPDQHRIHCQCQQCRPLDQKAGQNEDEAHVLRMSDSRIGTTGSQRTVPLGLLEHSPGSRDHPESKPDQNEAQDVERAKMRVGLPAEEHFRKVAGIVRKPVNARI